mgnify:CR=1 FL=1
MAPLIPHKIHWLIVRTNAGWCLRCTQLIEKQIVTIVKYDFIRFVDALSAAHTLQVTLNNQAALPLTKGEN